jgi:hypothetical protein
VFSKKGTCVTQGLTYRPKLARLLAVGVCLIVAACNRAALRIPDASFDFPETHTGYVAKQAIPARIEILPPVDMRAAHYSDKVAGTRWQGCPTDALGSRTASQFLQARIESEIAASKLFLPAQGDAQPKAQYVLNSEIDAFCSQVVGVIFERAAGIVAIDFSLTKDGKTVWRRKIEHVVTDADPEYSGGQLVTIEQAMRVTETDSLRLVLRDLLQDLDNSSSTLPSEGAPR